MAILSRTDYKALAGITDSSQDARLDALIPLVDDAIRRYTERSFDTADATESRTYQWDGRGAVEIDDVKNITAVTLDGTALTLYEQYAPGPDREGRYHYIEIGRPGRGFSTEMGFTWNADLYGSVWPSSFPAPVVVTGTFGYPAGEVPGSVKLAAYLAIDTLVDSPDSEALTSEAIESYARSWDTGLRGTIQTGNPQEFLPPRALTLLDPFTRRTGAA